jgi:hypothetical protein
MLDLAKQSEGHMKTSWILLMLLASPAAAQSSQIENACTTVAKNFLLTDNLNVGIVQSFPELKPPGVRMTYALRQGTAKSDMSDTFACEFQSTEPPFNLTRFCASTICYAPDDSDADRKRRFAEMRILLDRAQKK